MLSNTELLSTVKILASDLDGTFLDPDHNPSKGSMEAVRKYQAAGGIFAVCTGRDLGSARGVLKELDLDKTPGVYLNGTTVKGPNGELLQNLTLPLDLVDSLVTWGRANRKDASILFVVGDDHYVMDKSEEWAMFMHRHLLDPDPIEVKGAWVDPNPEVPRAVNMMRVICSPDKIPIVKPQVAALVAGKSGFAQSLPTTLDIMAPKTNKATGLHVLLQHLGLGEGQAAAIGDSENDLEMLQSVKVACAMGNAVKKTKAVSHFVMPKNTDAPAGVATLLHALTDALEAQKGVTTKVPEKLHRVACFCSGSWGAGVARMVGQATLRLQEFEEQLRIWVPDEEDTAWDTDYSMQTSAERCGEPGDGNGNDGRAVSKESTVGMKVVDCINLNRENSKYLPGLRMPRNVVASTDPKVVARDADILIFVVMQDELAGLLDQLVGCVKPTATAVVMSKVVRHTQERRIQFGTDLIREKLRIPVAALMGGTLALDVARGFFAEATLGCEDPTTADLLLRLFNRPNFSVSRVPSPRSVELFSVLKSIISLASGFCDGLNLGTNSKAAVIRIGAAELTNFVSCFFPEQQPTAALNEACGYTDIIASSFGNSRSRRCAELYAKNPGKSWEEVAKECLRSGMPAGLSVAKAAMQFITDHRMKAEFPFITKVHSIITGTCAVSTLTQMTVARVRATKALKVAVLGSGNWGTAIARLVARNVQQKMEFDKVVKMWVFEEVVDGKKLTEIINTEHENVKYLPGVELPHNLMAEPDPVAAVKDASILIFVLPHQFLPGLITKIKGNILPDAIGVCLIKGYFEVNHKALTLKTGTQVITEMLGIQCTALNGANVANDVALDHFAEATLGCMAEEDALMLSNLLNCPTFNVRTSPDVLGVELFGGLKNVIALAAGFCDGLGLPQTTKAAVLRRGLLEMADLVHELFPSSRPETVIESCGFADLLTTCYGGRNRKCAEAFAKDHSKSWEDIEKEELGGQKLQGPGACLDMQALIAGRSLEKKFPLFTAIHAAVTKKIPPEDVFTCNGFMRAGKDAL